MNLAGDTAPALVSLPDQPAGVPWPEPEWPEARGGDVGVIAAGAIDAMFAQPDRFGTTFGAVVIHRGQLVAERYGGRLEHLDRPDEPVTSTTPLLSWSMAKSMLHAVVGMLVGEGRLVLDAPAPVPAWHGQDDRRAQITLDHLLSMRDGLDFTEDYVDAQVSDVIEMLFGAGAGDVARFAADRGTVAPPGERFNYSSGTSNIVSGIVAEVVGRGDAYEAFLRDRLFAPLGMTSARATFDDAGTWIASSYVHATARDYARFGLLYLRDGVWNGRRLLPEGWVDHGRRTRSVDVEEDRLYGSHWWVLGDALGTFWANGYEGQNIMVCPALDLVAVRLGKTPADRTVELTGWRRTLLADVARATTP